MHKEPSLKARLELFATNITVLEMRWQHVPNLGCRDTETAQTIMRGASTWYNHVIVVSRALVTKKFAVTITKHVSSHHSNITDPLPIVFWTSRGVNHFVQEY